jgi:hypothetical protein
MKSFGHLGRHLGFLLGTIRILANRRRQRRNLLEVAAVSHLAAPLMRNGDLEREPVFEYTKSDVRAA